MTASKKSLIVLSSVSPVTTSSSLITLTSFGLDIERRLTFFVSLVAFGNVFPLYSWGSTRRAYPLAWPLSVACRLTFSGELVDRVTSPYEQATLGTSTTPLGGSACDKVTYCHQMLFMSTSLAFKMARRLVICFLLSLIS